MRRRRLLALFGGAAILWQPGIVAADRIPVIGVLWHAANADEEAAFLGPLREGFLQLGYEPGKNIRFEDRYPGEIPERFDRLAAELVSLKVDALMGGSVPAALALQRATSTIPIIIVANPDPVGLKLVASLARPGGNITGLSTIAFDLAEKRVQLLKEAIPGLTRIALLVNPNVRYDAPRLISEIQPVIDRLHLFVAIVEAGNADEMEDRFAKIAQDEFGAVIVAQNALFFNERRRIAALALQHGLATMVPANLFTEAGGLMSYGPSWPPIFRRAAVYADKILKGAHPADLPVEQPTEFELAVNLRTARKLGLEFPRLFLAQADTLID